ncbi:MAG TPA: helix-turn-helix transcriptional regulator [Pseudomonadales bacterium]|nr:helix-turn-helix transcriptional regulator [Pseudomonadales bacterium]
MSKVQFIERDGVRAFAVIPIDLFERMAEKLGDLEDQALFDEAKAADDGFRVPGAVAHAILDGTHPVKAWRDHRGFTQDALARAAGISKAYLCQIETGKRTGATKTLKALAKVLNVTVDDLS